MTDTFTTVETIKRNMLQDIQLEQIDPKVQAHTTPIQQAYLTIITSEAQTSIAEAIRALILKSAPETSHVIATQIATAVAGMLQQAQQQDVSSLDEQKVAQVLLACFQAYYQNVSLDEQEELVEAYALAEKLLQRLATTLVEIGATLPQTVVDYLRNNYTISQWNAESIVALSPNEIEKRRVVFEIFELALSMLYALQRCSALMGETLTLFTNLQHEYVTMLSKLYMYTSAEDVYIHPNDEDFGQTLLGLDGHLKVEDVFNFLLWHKPSANDGFTTYITDANDPRDYVVTWKSIDSGSISYTEFQLHVLKDGTMYTTLNTYSSTTASYVPTIISDIYRPDTASKSITQQKQEGLAWLMKSMTTSWNQVKDSSGLNNIWNKLVLTSPSWRNWCVRGPCGLTHQSDSDKASATRAEINSQMQTYMQNIQALKQLAEDSQKSQSSALSKAQQATENMISLLSSITDSCKSLVTAICRT